MAIWNFFATYILRQAPYMIGFITLIGYALMKKKWYDILGGTLKAIIGMLILNVGSGGLVSNFRPILAGLKDRFNLTACVIDPYYGQNAVTAGVEEVFGKGFSQVMTLLLIAFIVNILLVRFNKVTKCRTLFTTGHVQVQQAATAYWLIMFALPALLKNDVLMLVVMSVILGAYWAVGSNLTVKPMQELTDGAGFAIAHQQMFGIRLGYIVADKVFGTNGGKKQKEIKKVGDMEMPGFFSIFNENMVCTAILMTVFFGAIMAVIGRPYFIEKGNIKEADSFFMYVLNTCLNFAVYLAILQLGVRTFVTELTASFQGIADKLLPSSVRRSRRPAGRHRAADRLQEPHPHHLRLRARLLRQRHHRPRRQREGRPQGLPGHPLLLRPDPGLRLRADCRLGRHGAVRRLPRHVRLGDRVASVHRHHEVPGLLRRLGRRGSADGPAAARVPQGPQGLLPHHRGLRGLQGVHGLQGGGQGLIPGIHPSSPGGAAPPSLRKTPFWGKSCYRKERKTKWLNSTTRSSWSAAPTAPALP